MSWTFSAALAAAYSAAFCADIGSSARLKLTPSVDLFWCGDKTPGSSRLFRYGMTFGHLTVERGAALLMWYQEVSLARISVVPVTAPELLVQNLRSGSRCCELFAKYDRDTSSWKTPRNLFGTGWTLCSAAWKRAGTMRNGVCWERMTSGRIISVNDVGFSANCGRTKKFRTPLASAGSNSILRAQGIADYRTQMKSGDPSGGKLSPEWVEWLMGVPIGWTDLKGSAMLKSRCVRQ